MSSDDTARHDAAHLLAGHPFAKGLSAQQLEALAACGRVEQLREGQVIFREGENAGAMFLIVRGRVVLEQRIPARQPLQLESLTAGDMLGLSWLFPGSRWVLEARAAEPTVALVFDAACVLARMDADPELGFTLAKHVIQQLYERLERVRLQRLDVYRSDR